MNSESEDQTPPELRLAAENAADNLLPSKSKILYEKAFYNFKKWSEENKTNLISENILLAYFINLSKKYAPSTCWQQYSFLRSTILIYKKINIAEYNKLIAFLKRNSNNYKPKQSKTLSNENLREFLENAPDETHLVIKVRFYLLFNKYFTNILIKIHHLFIFLNIIYVYR